MYTRSWHGLDCTAFTSFGGHPTPRFAMFSSGTGADRPAMPLCVQFKVSLLLTALGGRTGAVAKFDGSGPVRLRRNATISWVSSSVSVLPNCTRAITFTASSNVATEPSWKYGGVIATLRRLGTLNTYRSAGSLVAPNRPLSM